MRRHYAAWFLISATFFCLFLAAQSAPAPYSSSAFSILPDFVPAPEMQKHFAEFNKEYFGNRLPKNTEIAWSIKALRDEGYMGLTIEDDEGFTILLDIQMKNIGYEKVSDATLIHEMAHVDCYPIFGHGKCFQDDMLRIATMGGFRDIW